MPAKLCRPIYKTGDSVLRSGNLINVKDTRGFQIGERIEIFVPGSYQSIGFATCVRDLSQDPRYQNIKPYSDPRARNGKPLQTYNSAEGFWEFQVE